MQTVLEVKQVTKQYSQQYALDHVSLSIQKGDIYGLIGKNGALAKLLFSRPLAGSFMPTAEPFLSLVRRTLRNGMKPCVR